MSLPDFLLEVSRVLIGLGLATALFHALTPAGAVEVALIALFAFPPQRWVERFTKDGKKK